MEKVTLYSDEQYFDYCVANGIGCISRTYASTSYYVYDDSGEKCDFWKKWDNVGHCIYIHVKPKSYPCVFVWHCDEGDHDFNYGEFVYQDDLKQVTKESLWHTL